MVEQALEANARHQPTTEAKDAGERKLTLETEAGLYRATSGADLRLPDTFPADIRLPDDARIVSATELGPTLSLGLYSPRSVALVFAEFRRAQRAAGWAETAVREESSVRIVGLDKQGRHVDANFVDEPDGGTTLAITVGPAAD